MKYKYLNIIFLLTIVSPVLISVLIGFLFKQHIYSIDLIRILNSQAFYSNEIISKYPKNKNWIDSIKKVNILIRDKVKLIAGKNSIVIISPSVIQGSEDITDKVLIALGLPRKIPNVQEINTPLYKNKNIFE